MGSEVNEANNIILISNSSKSSLKAINTNESGSQYFSQ